MWVRRIQVAWVVVLVAAVTSAAGAPGQKVTLVMGEEGARMFFRPARVVVQAGREAELVLVNQGKLKHEFMAYALPRPGTSRTALHDWAEQNSMFAGIEVKVEAGGVEVEARDLLEVEVAPGRSVELKFTPRRTGTFEMACLIRDPVDHYAAGMKGTLVVQ